MEPKEQHARKNYQGQTTLNNYLEKLSSAVNGICRNALANGINPSFEFMKQHLDNFLNASTIKVEVKKITLLEAYDEYCKLRSAAHAIATCRKN